MSRASMRFTPQVLAQMLPLLPPSYRVVGSEYDPDYVTLVVESEDLRPETRSVTMLVRCEGNCLTAEIIPLH